MTPPARAVVTSLAIAAGAPAQSATLSDPQDLLGPDFRIAIHSHADDPEFGPYGIWAAGRGYKVSFDGGMEVHPYLGRTAPRGLPLSWTTTGVSVGGHVVYSEGAGVRGVRAGDHRFEYHHDGGLVERYDVLSEGLEQSFVVPRPRGPLDADLLVRGRLSTALVGQLRPIENSMQAGIAFDSPDEVGREVLHYGAAIAIDADGARCPVTTEFEHGEVTLRIPRSFVAHAAWPLVVDPLIAPTTIALGFDTLESDVASAGVTGFGDVMTVFSAAVSGADDDVFAFSANSDFTNPILLFSDLGSGVRSTSPRVAFARTAGPTGRWTLVFERDSGTSRIRAYVIDAGEQAAQNGHLVSLVPTRPGATDRNPDVGGANGTTSLVVYQSDLTTTQADTTGTDVYSVFLDADSPAFIGRAPIEDPAAAFDRENASVSTWSTGPDQDWIVAYQRRAAGVFGSGDWEIHGACISLAGTGNPPTRIAASMDAASPDLVEPDVDAFNGRGGLVALQVGAGTFLTPNLEFFRFDWIANPTPTWIAQTHIDSFALAGATLEQPRIAHDRTSRSHWGVCYGVGDDEVRLARIGFDGTIVATETSTSVDGSGSASIAYDTREGRYVHVYRTTDLLFRSLRGVAWTYPDAAVVTSYGSACGAAMNDAPRRPLLRTEDWFVRITGAGPFTPCALFLGFTSTAFDLTPLGAPGCELLTDPAITLAQVTNASGDASVFLDLTAPVDAFFQWFYVDPTANPLGVAATCGLEAPIR